MDQQSIQSSEQQHLQTDIGPCTQEHWDQTSSPEHVESEEWEDPGIQTTKLGV